MFKTIKTNQVLFLTLLSLSTQSFALPTDRDQPIYVAADRASIDDNTGITVYSGKVEISQGSLILKGDRIELYRDSEGVVDRIRSIGRPAYFEQQPEVDEAITYAEGAEIDYKVEAQLMVITDNAKIKQAGDEFTGAKIQYDMDKAQVEAYSDSDKNQRVRMVIQPGSKAGS